MVPKTSFLNPKITSAPPLSPHWKIRKIGIAMAIYRPDLCNLREQLQSIQDQSFLNWICVISSDSPLTELLEAPEIEKFKQDPRFQWHENPSRLGHKHNFEKATQLTLQEKVDAISFSDQDDLWYPEKLALSAALLEQKGPLCAVHCDMHILTSHSEILPKTGWDLEKRGVLHKGILHLLIRNIVAGCGLLMDAQLLQTDFNIPEAAHYHDHWYALIAASQGGVHPIFTPLYAYRQHSENVVGMTPFRGIFTLPKALPNKINTKEIFQFCQQKWANSHALALAARHAKLPLAWIERLLLISPLDLGFGLFILGLMNLRQDRPFARACFARSLGKFLSRF